MPRPNVRWNVVIDVPTVLLSAIKLAQSPTRVLGAVERQLAPPPLRAYILPLNNNIASSLNNIAVRVVLAQIVRIHTKENKIASVAHSLGSNQRRLIIQTHRSERAPD